VSIVLPCLLFWWGAISSIHFLRLNLWRRGAISVAIILHRLNLGWGGALSELCEYRYTDTLNNSLNFCNIPLLIIDAGDAHNNWHFPALVIDDDRPAHMIIGGVACFAPFVSTWRNSIVGGVASIRITIPRHRSLRNLSDTSKNLN
jgi:hypothetical protein